MTQCPGRSSLSSAVGIHIDILTDQGTPFVSKPLVNLHRLLQVKHLRISILWSSSIRRGCCAGWQTRKGWIEISSSLHGCQIQDHHQHIRCSLAVLGSSIHPTWRAHHNAVALLDDVIVHTSTWARPTLPSQEGYERPPERQAQTTNHHLGLTKAQYLGYCIGHGLLKPQEKRVETIKVYPQPSTK